MVYCAICGLDSDWMFLLIETLLFEGTLKVRTKTHGRLCVLPLCSGIKRIIEIPKKIQKISNILRGGFC